MPAAFIGGFSADSETSSRDRFIWVMRRANQRAYRSRAANIGCINNFYRLASGPDPDRIDGSWASYEPHLTRAIDEIVDSPTSNVSAQTWLQILVPFIAGLFVRGPDFNQRFDDRLKRDFTTETIEHLASSISDNTNGARLFELQRLLAPIMSAEWLILHTPGDLPLISNDLGLAIAVNSKAGLRGWAIPLRKDTILIITPAVRRTICFFAGEKWLAPIDHRVMRDNDCTELNFSIAQASQDFILGPTQSSVDAYAQELRNPSTDPKEILEPWPFTHRMLLVHEFEWHRAVTAIQKPPSELRAEFPIEWNLGYERSPVFNSIFLPANIPQFEPRFSLRGRGLYFEWTHQSGFTDQPPGTPAPWEATTEG